jgi:cellulose biosynthesis protein BcsQ
MFLNDFLNSQESDLSRYIYPSVDEKLGIIFCDQKIRARDKVHSSDQNWFLQKKQQLSMALSKLDYDFIIFDITPGMHFFAINIIAISNEVFLMARPDVQNLKGITILLDKIYSKTVQLSGAESVNIHIIFNQLPIYEKIDTLVEEWNNHLSTKYRFLKNFHQFYYEPETSYNTAIQKFVLPENDPTYGKIKLFVKKNYLTG